MLFLGFGIFLAQSNTWAIVEKNFYELGKKPGYIPTGDQLKPVILGFDHFVANLYWIRSAQYVGGNSGAFEFDALPDYINLITDLDPHFAFAYKFGALVLPLGEKTLDKVIPLLNKGIEANKDSHHHLLPEMYINKAFYTYYYLDDLKGGADIYEKCYKQIKGCPPYARNVAAYLRARMGKHAIALRIWLEKASEKVEKSEEMIQLEQRKIEESSKLVALTCAAQNYKKRYKFSIENLSDLKNEAVFPCSDFEILENKKLFQKLSLRFDLKVVSDKTLTSPYNHNPFEWDAKNNKVSAKFWKKKF